MSDQGNIFLTYENLAFSMPLIAVVSIYLFFTHVPLPYALGILAGLVLIYQIRSQWVTQRAKKLQNLDESAIQDIVSSLENEADDAKAKQDAKKKGKAKSKAKQRKTPKGADAGQGDENDEEEDDDLMMFAKGSRKTKTN